MMVSFLKLLACTTCSYADTTPTFTIYLPQQGKRRDFSRCLRSSADKTGHWRFPDKNRPANRIRHLGEVSGVISKVVIVNIPSHVDIIVKIPRSSSIIPAEFKTIGPSRPLVKNYTYRLELW
jgi:hypothetical protein